MNFKNIFLKFKQYHNQINGSTIQFKLDDIKTVADNINKTRECLKTKDDTELSILNQKLMLRARNGDALDSLLIESYSITAEVIKRTLRMTPFDVQLIGAVALHKGKLIEMQTGEGKTLTALFPAILNALSGKGVHILTFNDYLAKRDAQWMEPVYSFLGLTTGFIQEKMTVDNRRNAYNCDVTYLTSKETGFDFLRDSICSAQDQIVHRPFNFAIVDEADSILIDEARIPLVIAGSFETEYNLHERKMLADIDDLASILIEKQDFDYDAYARNIYLTENGAQKAESILGCENIYDDSNITQLSRLLEALHAHHFLQRDKHYIVRNDKVELVDDFTGRVADQRRWPDGLQQALEQKEQIGTFQKGTVLNSIPLQYVITRYPKISGMTATAQPSEEEFREFYDLHITVIQSNKPCIRKDYPDMVFCTKEQKFDAVVKEIKTIHHRGQPILVGTGSVAESILIAERLENLHIPCRILNAKNDEYEASIIADAGTIGSVTITTNMAGRGTDIRLGGHDEKERKKVVELGGLFVIGLNRHESQRIDNQLRGRAGRQGDPGVSRFYVSLEDDIFVQYHLKELIPKKTLEMCLSEHINNQLINAEIDRIQPIAEGQNLETKITLCKYSIILEQQRNFIFGLRNEMIKGDSVLDLFKDQSPEKFNQLNNELPLEQLLMICRKIVLNQIDLHWSNYLAAIGELRKSIHLRRIGGQDPLFEFRKITMTMFDELRKNIEIDSNRLFEQVFLKDGVLEFSEENLKIPSATWTYLVNDCPDEDRFLYKFIGDIGFSTWAGILFPLTAVYLLLKKFSKKKLELVREE